MGLPAPVSLARQEGAWTLYDRRINQVTCAQTITVDGAEETWVGTHEGIKRLDATGKLLHRYTSADGLPGNYVGALAVEPKDAWCVVYGSSLCHLDRVSDRWQTLRQIPVEDASDSNFIASGTSSSVAFILRNVSRSQGGVSAFLFDRQQHTWQEARWTMNPSLAPNPTGAYTARSADGDNLYLSTAQGLAQYHAATQQWDWFLPAYSILGMTDAGNHAVWLAALTKTDTRFAPPTAALHLLLFDLDKNTVTADYPATATTQFVGGRDRLTFPGSPFTLVPADDGGLWLLSHYIPIGLTNPPSLVRFDLHTHDWRQIDMSLPETAATLPLPVLYAALLAGYALPTATLVSRLPGWVSPAAVLPDGIAPLNHGYPERPAPPVSDTDGSAWSVTNRSVLMHQTAAGKIQRFPLSDMTLAGTPPIEAVTVAGDTLYALTYFSPSPALWSRKLPNGLWIALPLPPAPAGFPFYRARLFGFSGQVWMQAGSFWRWDPAARQWVEALKGIRANFVGIDNGSLWLTGGTGYQITTFYRLDPGSEAPVALGIDPLTAEIAYAHFIAMTNGIAWSGSGALSGYDVNSHHWTTPLQFTNSLDSVPLLAADGSVYVTSFTGKISRFDFGTRQWANFAPAPPIRPGEMG